ncbi:patatin-like phospholipase family protein [Mesorhizobium xinjiangense]|uniref:patatin-like phospholipase family protein n=1 Tax=Mesorhizobium xinjiangense TaxID=2678685 RepID=UPI0012ED3B91|nr:patatin-like phospholipase family protein [Mesorhizobium xinjiangense]
MKQSAARKGSRSGSPTFAVAFGGGGARGLAHIHAIEVMNELGVEPVMIAGSSIGAIMGGAMASGMSGREINEYAHSILGRRAEVASRMWRARPGTFAEFVSGGLRIGQFNIERLLDVFLPEQIPERFEDLKIPLKVTATDYFQHELAVFDSGELRSAMAASAAIPAVFRPVRRDGRTLIDGGIYSPVPFELLDNVADIVIAIDVVGAPTPDGKKTPTTIELLFGATQLMMQSINALKLRSQRPEIFLRPPVSRFRALDFLKISAVMAETASLKDELKLAVADAVARYEEAAEG